MSQPDMQRQQRRERERQLDQRSMMQSFDEEGQLSAEYLAELSDTELNMGTISVLENMVTRDFVLGYLDAPEVHEQKWLARVAAQRVYAMHPGENCVITGEYRAQLYGDDHENLMPLSDREKEKIRAFIKGIFLRVSRSKEGWQQDKIGEQVKVNRVEDEKREECGGLLGGIM